MSSQAKFRLYFDNDCPVCASFVKLLRTKTKASIEYIPFLEDSSAKDFLFCVDDVKYSGKEGVTQLSKYFPEVLDYFWILPPDYKLQAAQKMYGFAGAVRKLYRKITGRNCNKCNKNK